MGSGSSRRRGVFTVRPLSVVLVFLVLTGGCLGNGSGGGDSSVPSTPTDDVPSTVAETETTQSSPTVVKPPGGLDSRLFQLVRAENRTAYADRHGLDVRDGRVLVVITLASDGALPDRFEVEIELVRDDERLGYVRIDDLVDLASSPDVVRINPPERGTTDRITTSQQPMTLTDT